MGINANFISDIIILLEIITYTESVRMLRVTFNGWDSSLS